MERTGDAIGAAHNIQNIHAAHDVVKKDPRHALLQKVRFFPILDIGTGNGQLSMLAATEYGFSTTSIDTDPKKLKRAWAAAHEQGVAQKIEFMEMDACFLTFGDHSFGTVLSYQTIHHSRFPNRIIDEMFRVCRPGGSVIISELNTQGFELFSGEFERYSEEHHSDNAAGVAQRQDSNSDPDSVREQVDCHDLGGYIEGKSSRFEKIEGEFTCLYICEK